MTKTLLSTTAVVAMLAAATPAQASTLGGGQNEMSQCPSMTHSTIMYEVALLQSGGQSGSGGGSPPPITPATSGSNGPAAYQWAVIVGGNLEPKDNSCVPPTPVVAPAVYGLIGPSASSVAGAGAAPAPAAVSTAMMAAFSSNATWLSWLSTLDSEAQTSPPEVDCVVENMPVPSGYTVVQAASVQPATCP